MVHLDFEQILILFSKVKQTEFVQEYGEIKLYGINSISTQVILI